LEVHHIKYRSNGGSDTPTNLITLCYKHHKSLHDGKIILNVKKHKSLNSATTMNVIRSQLLKLFPDAIETFGYVTKANRYKHGIEKTHSNDAFVIADGSNQERGTEQKIIFKRKNNRSIQLNRNGYAPSIRKQMYSIQPNDLVEWSGKTYISKGCHNKGARVMILDGIKRLSKSIKQITLIYQNKGVIYV
jgi:hypothetical protein